MSTGTMAHLKLALLVMLLALLACGRPFSPASETPAPAAECDSHAHRNLHPHARSQI